MPHEQKLRNPKILAGVALGVVAVIAAGAWIVLVGPERSKVGKLDGQITAVQTQITQRKAALAPRRPMSTSARATSIA